MIDYESGKMCLLSIKKDYLEAKIKELNAELLELNKEIEKEKWNQKKDLRLP